MLRVGDILSGLLDWAPRALAWDRDNIGLLIGDPGAEVSTVLVCLDITPGIVAEAVERGAECIIAHHPVIFHPLKSIRTDTPSGGMVASLLRHGVHVIAMHTNADAANGGLNTTLAAKLGLKDLRPLDRIQGHQKLLVLRTAADSDTRDIEGMLEAGGALSWSVQTEAGGAARVYSIRVPSWRLPRLQSTLAAAASAPVHMHTVTLADALELEGIGTVGTLDAPMTAQAFLAMVKAALGCDHLRVTPFTDARTINRVAVCSGSGSSYVGAAIRAGADAMVTGDLTHHVFLDHQEDILLVDAGHFDTEKHFISLCAEELDRRFFEDKQKINILTARTDTNPVWFV